MFSSFLVLLGRLCMSALFFWAGFAKLLGIEGTMQYMASKQMPMIPLFLAGALLLQLGGGFLIFLGYYTRLGAGMLIFFIIPASLIFHDFWNLQGAQRLTEQIMFMKDMGVLGGLFTLAAFGPGAYSLDAYFSRR